MIKADTSKGLCFRYNSRQSASIAAAMPQIRGNTMHNLKSIEQISQEYNASSEKGKVDIDRIVKRFEELMQALKERTAARLQMIKEMDNGTNCG